MLPTTTKNTEAERDQRQEKQQQEECPDFETFFSSILFACHLGIAQKKTTAKISVECVHA